MTKKKLSIVCPLLSTFTVTAFTLLLLSQIQPANATFDTCASQPCMNGATCQNITICPPLHANYTPFNINPPTQQYQPYYLTGAADCITRDGRYFAVMSPGQTNVVPLPYGSYGYIQIFNNTVQPYTLLNTIPTYGTSNTPPVVSCQFVDNGMSLVYGFYALAINVTGVPRYVSGAVVLRATNSSWAAVQTEYLICNGTVPGIDFAQWVATDVSGDGQYITIGLPTHPGPGGADVNPQIGWMCMFNRTNSSSEVRQYTELPASYPRRAIDACYDGIGEPIAGQQYYMYFGFSVKLARFGPTLMVSAPGAAVAVGQPGGCVYDIEYQVGVGYVSGNNGTCIVPASLRIVYQPYDSYTWGVALDCNDAKTSCVSMFPLNAFDSGTGASGTGGVAVLVRDVNGTWSFPAGMQLPPPPVLAIYNTASTSGLYAANMDGQLQMDSTGNLYCVGNGFDTGISNLANYSGSVWCMQQNSSGGWNLVGTVMTDGLGTSLDSSRNSIPGRVRLFGTSIALAKFYFSLSQPWLVIGSPWGANNGGGGYEQQGWFQLFGNDDGGYCAYPGEPAYTCKCVPGYVGFNCETGPGCYCGL